MPITDLDTLSDLEWNRRRAKFDQIWDVFQEDRAAVAEWQATDEARTARESEALGYLEDIGASMDPKPFAQSLEAWSRRPGHSWFAGMTMMFVNQLVNAAADDPGRTAALLYRVLSAPTDEASARVKMQELIDYVLAIQTGGQPAAGRVTTLCSFFWSMVDHDAWAVFWPSAAEGLASLGWLPREGSADSFVERYVIFRGIVDRMARPPKEVEKAFSYLKDHPFSGLDPALPQRLHEATELRASWNPNKGAYSDDAAELEAEVQARAVNGDILLFAQGLKDPLTEAMGHTLKVSKPYPKISWGNAAPFKTEGLVTLLSEAGGRGPAIRIEATDKGLAIGITPGWPPKDNVPKGYTKQIAEALENALPEGVQFIKVEESTVASRIEPVGPKAPSGSPFIGWWYAWDKAQAADADLVADAVSLGKALKPIFTESVKIATAGAVEVVVTPVPSVEGEPTPEAVDYLQSAADDLMFERSVLQEWCDLLEDKKQIIFYGPPGTGKTFVAQRMAQAIIDEDLNRYELTQLHPSSSYEDFFEGYRPETIDDSLVYTLKPGPLARMAEIAKGTDGPVVLVVDEINRANIPRVFGELLFLLEYRKKSIATLYRESFVLPDNFRMIGTMNTADRSIALVDAALRRRFHFIPLFPDQEPIADLLARYLADLAPDMAWVAGMVALVNDELIAHLGHRDFQIGPSHFMKEDLDEVKLRRIWDYSVRPLIEEQFYNDPEWVKRFEYKTARARFSKPSEAAAPIEGVSELPESVGEEALEQ